MTTFFLHGFAQDASAWREVLQEWQPQQPVLAIDLPGHGTAGPVRQGWQANLEAVAEQLGPTLAQGLVVGYSLGARVALGLVAQGLARRAVLIGVNPGLPLHERQERRRADQQWIDLLREQGIEAFAQRWEAQALFASQRRVAPAAREARRAVRRRHPPEGLAASLEHMGLGSMPDYWPVLSSLELTLVVGAEDSKFRTLAERAHEQARLPLERVEESGHDVPLEQPGRLAELLRRHA